MADVYAVKSGNWSDTTLWNTGSLPATIDNVYSNNFTVYVDGNYQVNFLTNAAGTGITVGGRFILNDGVSLSAFLVLGGADLVPAVQFLSADPANATIYANLSGTTVFRPQAITNSSSGTLTVYGSAVGATNNNSGTGAGVGYLQNISTGVLNVFGDIYGPTIGNTYYGINNTSSGTVNVVGNLYSRMNETGGVNPYVIRNESTGTVNVTGNVFGGQASGGIGIINASNGLVNILGNSYGGAGTIANRGADGVRNSGSGGIVNLIGDAWGGLGGHYGVHNASTGTVNITGICYATDGYGCNNAGTLNVIGGCRGGTTTTALGINNGTGGVVTLYGNVSGYSGTNANGLRNSSTGTCNVIGNTYGGQGTSTPGIRNESTGTINLTGNCYGYGYIPIFTNLSINGTGGYGIHNVAGGTVVVRGNVYSSNIRADAWGIYNQAGGSVTVFGNAYGGNPPNTTAGADGIRNVSTSTGTIILSGTAYGGAAPTAYGVNNLSTTAIVRVKRAAGNDWGLGYTTAIGSNPGVFGSQNGSTFVEELECGPRGQWPTAGNIYFTPNPKATSMFETDTFQNYSLIQSNSADNLVPPVSSVRQGEVYNLGLDIGACIIPPASSVAVNVPVDNILGTAVLTPTDTWNIPVTASDIDSMGGRLRNALNSDSAEKLINSFSS